jgi:hypothetical protein
MLFLAPNSDASELVSPLIFLAGPILGAPNWQAAAVRKIQRINRDIDIASPRTPPPFHGDGVKQVQWETKHLRLAAKRGCILFWLAPEKHHLCNRAYAQTTRFELAEWLVCSRVFEAKIAVGAHPSFPGYNYIKQRLANEYPNIPLHSTLEATCATACELAVSGRGMGWMEFARQMGE